jgi:pyrroline-5-carboxylate reductase
MTQTEQPTIGIIGLGSMGGAIAQGLVASGLTVVGYGRSRRIEGVAALGSAREVFDAADVIVLGVKPWIIAEVGREIAGAAGRARTVISAAAGVSINALRESFSLPETSGIAVVRSMPNLAAGVGLSCSAIYSTSASGLEDAHLVFDAIGSTVPLQREDQFHAFTGIAGSGPAFAFLFAEALADGGVREGMHRTAAAEAAAAMLRGAAEVLVRSTDGPATWKDRVCSPGGTTIAGVCALEDNGFRSATIAAVRAVAARSREMERGE